MKLSEVDDELKEASIMDYIAGTVSKAHDIISKKDPSLSGSIETKAANREAMRNYTKIAKGMVKMWAKLAQNYRSLNKFESAIMAGLHLVEDVARAGESVKTPKGLVITKSDDGHWYNEQGQQITNVNDVKQLEKRATLQRQTSAMSPKNQKAAINAPKTKTTKTKQTAPAGSNAQQPTPASVTPDPQNGQQTAPNAPPADLAQPQQPDTPTTQPAAQQAPESENLVKYKKELGQWLGKIIHITDKAEIDSILKDLKSTNPNDEKALLPVFIKAVQLGATHTDELDDGKGWSSSGSGDSEEAAQDGQQNTTPINPQQFATNISTATGKKVNTTRAKKMLNSLRPNPNDPQAKVVTKQSAIGKALAAAGYEVK